MTKELEAFNRITLHTEYDNDGSYDCLNFEDDCKLVNDALTRLVLIENVKPSEALECLKHIKNDDFNMVVATYPPIVVYNGVSKNEMFDTIEQALLQAKKDKAKIEKLKQENTILHIELATFEKLLFKKSKGE